MHRPRALEERYSLNLCAFLVFGRLRNTWAGMDLLNTAVSIASSLWQEGTPLYSAAPPAVFATGGDRSQALPCAHSTPTILNAG
jgi:hypothetical protein